MPIRSLIRIVLSISIAGAFAGWFLSVIPGRIEAFLFVMFFLTAFAIIGFVMFGIPLGLLYLLVNYYDIRDWYREFDRSKFREQFNRPALMEALAIPFVWFVFLFV